LAEYLTALHIHITGDTLQVNILESFWSDSISRVHRRSNCGLAQNIFKGIVLG
jgi:hypothetical protein